MTAVLLLALAVGPNAETLLSPAQRERLREQAAVCQKAAAEKDEGRLIALIGQSLAIDREVFGQVRGGNVEDLDLLARLETKAGRMAEALASRREALEVTKALRGEAGWQTAEARLSLRSAERRSTMPPEGRARWLRIEALTADASAKRAGGQHGKAAALVSKAQAEAVALLGEAHHEPARLHFLLGSIQGDMGELAAAEGSARKAEEALARLVGRRHPEHARAVLLLGGVARLKGEYGRALRLTREALAVLTACHGWWHLEVAYALEGLSIIHKYREEFGEAKAAILRCLAIREALLPAGDMRIIDARFNLANTAYEAFDTAAALRTYEEIQRALTAAPGLDPNGPLNVLEMIGRCQERLSKPRAARASFSTVLDGRRRLAGADSLLFALALSNFARLDHAEGDPGRAAGHMRQVSAILDKRLGPGHPDARQSAARLAEYLRDAGERDEALRLAVRAAGLIRPPGSGVRDAEILHTLAATYQALGQQEEARAAAERSQAVIRCFLGRASAGQSERELLAAEDAWRQSLGLLLSLPGPGPDADYAHVLAWKGSVHTAMWARRQALRSRPGEAARGLVADLDAVSRELGAAAAADVPPARAADHRRRIEALTRRKDELEGELDRASNAYRVARLALGRTPDALRRDLPGGTGLVDFFIYLRPDYRLPAAVRFEARVAAFILRPGAPAVRVELGPVGPITTAIGAWRRDMGSPRHGAALRRLLWLPLEPHLSRCGTVLVSPDGPFAFLPFAALPGKKEGAYLLEEVALAVAPVPRLLGASAGDAAAPPSMLTVGGVDHGGPGRWPALPGTRAEADAIAAGFKGDSLVLRGPDATAERLRREMPGRTHIHLATHGYAATRAAVAGEMPGLRSGLVLAGANKGGGVLTAQEVKGLDLSAARLVVLSACETGLGDVALGEGLLGLQRALHIAGARAAVTSLWSVNDAATSVLMERFYEGMRGDGALTPLEALRQAQLFVMRSPDAVIKREAELMRGLKRGESLRGAGKSAEKIVGGSARRSPVSWWAAFALSGDWR